MKLLKLFNLHLGPYKGVFVNNEFKENSMNAYIYDTKQVKGEEEACDASGNVLGTFMDTNARLALEAHVEKNIIPIIQGGLDETDYCVEGVDYTNQAPHPHLVIMRKDNMPLTDKDQASIRESLKSTIAMTNLARIQHAHAKHSARFMTEVRPEVTQRLNTIRGIFNESDSDEEESVQHHYNLRPRH